MKKLVILPIALVFLLVLARSSFAQTATLTATVRTNPLKVEISPIGVIPTEKKWFEIPVVVSNLGLETITKTEVYLHSSPKLAVRQKKKKIGNLVQGEETIIWLAKTTKPGSFVIQVEVVGKLAGEEISATDSEVINIFSSSTVSFFSSFFRLASRFL